MFKCLLCLAPPYLTEYCTPVSTIEGRRHLRSATTQLLFVPSYRTTFGSRSFAVSGLTVWIDLVRRVGVVVITPASWPKGARFESRHRHYVGTCNLGQVILTHIVSLPRFDVRLSTYGVLTNGIYHSLRQSEPALTTLICELQWLCDLDHKYVYRISVYVELL